MHLPFEIESIADGDWNAIPSDGARRQRKFRTTPKYARHPSSTHGKGGAHATLLELPICAIDGEGKTRPDGRHDYTLLAASWPGGHTRITGESLTSEECFEFLLSLPEHHTYVGYGLSYDTNMWLRMLPRSVVYYLMDNPKHRARFRHYRLEWIERKYFRISRAGRSFTIYDVLANWQTTFVKALEAWSVGTPAERALVQRMKDQRGNFDDVQDDAIEQYCYLECELLALLCRKLFDAILQTEYRPRAVYGPGALAVSALEHHRVKLYMATPPEPVNTLTRHAYFGGRFDCAMFGWFHDIYQYDIKSAYPHRIRFLPCLKCATWVHQEQGYERIRPREWGLYHVEWYVPDDAPWPPFPHRTSKGNVYYPYTGAGWYHADEVDAALAMYGEDCIRVTEAWHLQVNCEHKPFSFVDSLYALRKELESAGGYDKGVVIKLILNSLYGKLAQQVGGRKGKPPPFQSFFWAGAITAGTRAMILRALADNSDDVIGIATDSLVSARELDFLPLGGELGQWDYKHLSTYCQVSNGVYHGTYDDGKDVERARGLGRFVLNWDMVRADFLRTHGQGWHEYPGRARFVTLREARQRIDGDDVACRWIGPGTPTPTPLRVLNFVPARRAPSNLPSKRNPRMRLEPLAPNDYGAQFESQPFRLKTTWREVLEMREKHHLFAWSDDE